MAELPSVCAGYAGMSPEELRGGEITVGGEM